MQTDSVSRSLSVFGTHRQSDRIGVPFCASNHLAHKIHRSNLLAAIGIVVVGVDDCKSTLGSNRLVENFCCQRVGHCITLGDVRLAKMVIGSTPSSSGQDDLPTEEGMEVVLDPEATFSGVWEAFARGDRAALATYQVRHNRETSS